MKIGHLAEYLEASTVRFPDRTAVVGPVGEGLTYSELNRRSDALAAFFVERGIQQGDRVGVVLPKSVESVVAFFGIMKAGAAYVPVDAAAPAERSRRILADCKVRALITERGRLDVIPPAGDISLVLLTGETTDEPRGIGWEISRFESATRCGVPRTKPRNRRDLAYILYTSGSTGEPKGVMLTHENASSFIEWCSTVFHPSEHDRFSSHAPFHFDLSILDLYLAIKHGASVHLISEELGRNPRNLARFIGERRLTVWYSTPSILTLLLQFGNLPSHDLSHLRLILFAGEVFPVKHLRDLQRCLPAPVYYNLYGPTETNVCTFARIPERIPETRDMPYPIGPACEHCHALVLDDQGREVPAGGEGLLYISGPSVFQGYWNRPAENAAAFLIRNGKRWYNTGDIVCCHEHEGFIYRGRKDRMIKRRGYRVELGEIERALYKHPSMQEAAVAAIPRADEGLTVAAFLVLRGGGEASIIDLKSFCARHLPSYMIPDRFVFRSSLPKTSTDKTDYQRLVREFTEPSTARTNAGGVFAHET